MELEQLRTFYFVAKYGSLPKAANYLKLTAPAISLRLKKFEANLKTKLFERYPNRLELTDKGRLFLREVGHVFEAVDKLQDAIAPRPGSYSGTLTISLGRDLARFFAPQIASFSRGHPLLRITILSRSSPETLPLVSEGSVDFGIGRFLTSPRGLQKRALLDSRIYLVLPKNHPLAKSNKMSLTDISKYRLILHAEGAGTRKLIDAGFTQSGVELSNILEVGTCESIIELVQLGVGVGLVHDICLPTRKNKAVAKFEMSEFFKPIEVSIIFKPSVLSRASCRALMQTLLDSRRKAVDQ
jgi:DNA-binding transcriptional LysR family regulator